MARLKNPIQYPRIKIAVKMVSVWDIRYMGNTILLAKSKKDVGKHIMKVKIQTEKYGYDVIY